MASKRRKWDVAAPSDTAAPVGASALAAGGRAGIGAAGSGLPAQFSGFVTGQGLAKPSTAPTAAAISGYKPGDPLSADIIAKAQQGAAAAMEKINRVRKHNLHHREVDACYKLY